MKDKLRMNLQLFAEGDDNGGGEGQEEKTTFTKEEFETMKADLEKEHQEKLEAAKKEGMSEAERLAKLSEEEKIKESLKTLEEENQKYKQDEELRKLKDEAVKCLEDEKLPSSFADMVLGKDAEITKANIKVLKEVFSKSVQAEVEERLKGPSPKRSLGNGISNNDVSETFKNALKGGF
jgi:uncharacterized protein YejL (UPF0352 family)